jgi:DNA-binding MarR family transcriptional regulator
MPTHDATLDPLEAWHGLLQVSSRVLRELDRRLDDEHRLSVREFDVMINLDSAPGRIRMTDLANAVMLSSGGLTRLVGRLEERGFLRRESDADDGRAFLVSLTERGQARLAEARSTHDAVIADALAGALRGGDAQAFGRVLAGMLPAPSDRLDQR